MSLADHFQNTPKPQEVPKGFEPHVEVGSNGATIVTQPFPAGKYGSEALSNEDVDRILKDNGLTPGSWKVNSWTRATRELQSGDVLESIRLTVKPTDAKFGVVGPDLSAIAAGMERFKLPKIKTTKFEGTVVGDLADCQVGKVDINGGTEALLERVDYSLAKWEDYLQEIKPAEIILADLGDGIEGFENTAAQAQTNDLSLVDQIHLFGLIRWRWLEVAARNAPRVIDVSIPSNHTAVRRGKDVLNDPSNDYGLLVQRFMKDRADGSPEKFGHVSFHAPKRHEESLTIHAIQGHRLGFVHGHQASSVNGIDDWWYKQIAGRGPLEFAQTLNYGHYHHLNIHEGRGAKKIIGAPSVDNGSSWIRNLQGLDAQAGVLTYQVDEKGSFGWVVL